MQIFPSSRAEGAGGEHLARSAHAERVRAARWLGRFIPASCACAALMAASITPRALPAQRAVRPAATRAAATPSLDVALSARLLRMADGRTLDTALTDSALAAGSRWIRAQATLAIGQVHGLARAAALRVLLSDKDTTVAANAAYALGLMSDTASIEALAQALRASPNVATEAAWSLGELGAPAREVIERALEAPPMLPEFFSIEYLIGNIFEQIEHSGGDREVA